MSAAERLAALDDLAAHDLCERTGTVLQALVEIMNQETMLLRAGRYRQASEIAAEKIQLAQDYVALARAVQRRVDQLKIDVPADIERLRQGHESLATQMADNLRVIATARDVSETLLTDVAAVVGTQNRAKTYGANGAMTVATGNGARGIAVNRAL